MSSCASFSSRVRHQTVSKAFEKSIVIIMYGFVVSIKVTVCNIDTIAAMAEPVGKMQIGHQMST